MKIKNLFKNDIERKIPGVIKIGQDEYIKQELDEYVVTRELRSHFSNFFKAYEDSINHKTDDMGVWISGFFGSGKSHFLKILSYLMENRVVDHKAAIDYFDSKIEDEMTYSSMKLTGDIPTDVVLFNIDAKAETTGNKANAIINVFVKMFNELRGYCSTTPWIAVLEEKLDDEEKFEIFKETFKEISGQPWEEGRNDIFYEEDALIESLVKVRDMSEASARNLVEKSEENYSISIEGFAEKVNEYIQSKDDPKHHIVFLVDEIGQFIGEDTQMMLKLQTIVEELGSKCKGKAWVIVTSQADIDNLKKISGQDFSKIQGRFASRLSLSSANVDEVIKKRILAKKDQTEEYLKNKYIEKGSIIDNLITFSSDTPEAKNYKSKEIFSEVYPFIPYQFQLLQNVFSSIRKHGASGKHLAEGERSLLSAFQESALKYRNKTDDLLIPFYAFYDTIESFLDHNIRIVFENAKNNSTLDDFDMNILKILFMIKYVKTMPKKVENIAALMIDSINNDKLALKENIKKSLKRLKMQMLIEENGEEYIFLTDEEQEVNKEIQNISVSPSDVLKKAQEIIFAQIYPENKYRYNKYYDYSFMKQIDGHTYTKTEDIGVNLLTRYAEDVGEATLKLRSSRNQMLIIKMNPAYDFINEIEMQLKIEKFLRNTTIDLGDRIEEIKQLKRKEIREREERGRRLLEDSILKGQFYVNGQLIEPSLNSVEKAIDFGFEKLLTSVYTKLEYIENPITQKSSIQNTIEQSTSMVPEPTDRGYNDVKRHIDMQSDRYEKIAISKIMNKFTTVPYGWNEENIALIIVELMKYKRIRLQYNSEDISNNNPNLVDYLMRKTYRDKIVIKKREVISSILKNNVNLLIKDIFNKNHVEDDEDRLEEYLRDHIKNETDEIKDNLKSYEDNSGYPGKAVLTTGKDLFESIIQTTDQLTLFNNFIEEKNNLLNYRDDVEAIRNFLENQSHLLDQSLKYLKKYDKEKQQFISHGLDTSPIDKIAGIIKEIIHLDYPYERLHELNDLNNNFIETYITVLIDYSKPVKSKVNKGFDKLINQCKKLTIEPLTVEDFINKDYNTTNKIDIKKILKDLKLHERVKAKNKAIQEKLENLIQSASSNLVNFRDRLDKAGSINDIDAIQTQSSNSISHHYDRLEKIKDDLGNNKSYTDIHNIIVDRIKEEDENWKPPKPPKSVKVDRNLKVQEVFDDSVTIKSKEDIDVFVKNLKEKLEKELEDSKSIQFIWGK